MTSVFARPRVRRVLIALVVAIIAFVVAAIVLPCSSLWVEGGSRNEAARMGLARAQARLLAETAVLSRWKEARRPTVADLAASDGIARLDPWGHEYRLQTAPGHRVRASSAGPDGLWGTADDISVVLR